MSPYELIPSDARGRSQCRACTRPPTRFRIPTLLLDRRCLRRLAQPSRSPTATGRSRCVIPVVIVLVTLHGSLAARDRARPSDTLVHAQSLARHRAAVTVAAVRALSAAASHASQLTSGSTDPLDDPGILLLARRRSGRAPGCRSSRTVPADAADARRPRAHRLPSGASARFLRTEVRSARARSSATCSRVWLEHLLWCMPVIAVAASMCAACRCGSISWRWWCRRTAIQLIRSFAEHRARPRRRASASPWWKARGSWVRCSSSITCIRCITRRRRSPGTSTSQRYRMIRERLLAENGGLRVRHAISMWRGASCSVRTMCIEHPTGRVPAPCRLSAGAARSRIRPARRSPAARACASQASSGA